MTTREEFIEDITQVTPSTNVTDESVNTPHSELQNNIKFIANLLSNTGSSGGINIFSQNSGNLLNNDSRGVASNNFGGVFSSFDAKNSFKAIENNIVVNEEKINTSLALDALIWNGAAGTVESGSNTQSFLEKDIFIPSSFRGQHFVLAIKGTGMNFVPTDAEVESFTNGEIPFCNASSQSGISVVGQPICVYTNITSGTSGTSGTPTSGTSGTSGTPTSGTSGTPTSGTSGTCDQTKLSNCFARYENVLIEVIGASVETKVIRTLGPWPNHDYFSNHIEWQPKYRTIYISFTIPDAVSSIKIRIYRTRTDGAVAFSNMYLGTLAIPYSEYVLNNIDINEIYNFKLGLSKINASTTLGHHISPTLAETSLSNILTKQQILQTQLFNKYINNFNWDQISGPRQVELDNENSNTPKISTFEFDSGFTRYMHFDARVDGPNPGTAFLGVSYFANENSFSNSVDCSSYVNSDCNPPYEAIADINLTNVPTYGTPGTLDSSGNPQVICAKKDLINGKYIYSYYFPNQIPGQIPVLKITGYSTISPPDVDANYLEEYRNKWLIESVETAELENYTCLLHSAARFGITFKKDLVSVQKNIILPAIPNATSVNAVCQNVKFDIFIKIINPGDSGNPDFSSYRKIESTVAIPSNIINTNKMGYFEVYSDFYNELKNNRGSIALFTISRDGNNSLDTFGGNFSISGIRLGLADPPEDPVYDVITTAYPAATPIEI